MFKKSKNKGFSMVELIVVIAVLAIIIAILSPTLITYVERSRAQKDYSSMDEVVNAVEIAMADQNIHDEVYRYSCANNYITYTDSSGKYGQKIKDEEFWAPDGSGRATTITFNPVKNAFGATIYKLDEAIVNDMTYGNGSTGQSRTMQGAIIEKNQCYLKNASAKDDSTTAYLYHRINQIVGDKIKVDSQAYGNSSFTIFIRWDTVDGVARPNVYGSFNGTNLSEGAPSSNGSGTYDYDENDNPISNQPEDNKGGLKPTPTFSQSDLSGTGSFSGGIDYKDNQFDILEKDYEFEFYSSMKLAVDDVNAGTLGKNADVDRANAVAGIYTDKNGAVTVMLLRNSIEYTRLKPAVDMTINLGGHTLSSTDAVCVQPMAGIITIDGRIRGSKIEMIRTNSAARPIQANQSAATTIISGGTYVSVSNGYAAGTQAAIYVSNGAKVSVSNVTIETTETSGIAAGIHVTGESTFNISKSNITAKSIDNLAFAISINNGTAAIANCKIKSNSQTGETKGVSVAGPATATLTNCDIKATTIDAASTGVGNLGVATITNCDIKAYSNLTHGNGNDDGYYGAYSNGVYNTGTLTISDCCAIGTLSGIANEGTLHLNGGTYEGFYGGGVYFAGIGTSAYARNAIIRQCNMPSGYTTTFATNGAGLYIGGDVGNDNISVYMNNCDIYGSKNQIVFRGTDGEKNNSLYISNSTINDMDGKDIAIRIDNDTHRLYIGKGNNFNITNATSGGAIANFDGIVINTNEIYNES